MANTQHNRIPPAVLADDIEAYLALKAFAAYLPSNDAYSFNALSILYDKLRAAEEAELQARNAAAAARDALVAAQLNFHEIILGVKDQVKAQFGADSDEFASLGMKKASEKKRTRRTRGSATGA